MLGLFSYVVDYLQMQSAEAAIGVESSTISAKKVLSSPALPSAGHESGGMHTCFQVCVTQPL